MGPVEQEGQARRAVVGVSLKMYFDAARSVRWARRVAEIASAHPATRDGRVDLFVLPSVTAIEAVRDAVEGSPVRVGAQDLFWEDRGAYTGGVSGVDLAELGCRYVEVGHSERRRYFAETDVTVQLKLAAAFRNGLIPVLCIGEPNRGSADDAAAACRDQLEAVLAGQHHRVAGSSIVVAYEPEWAIGGEASAGPEHVARVATALRAVLAEQAWIAESSVVYGGSAGPGLLSRLGGEVDGLFLGRFAHDPEAVGAVLDEAMALR